MIPHHVYYQLAVLGLLWLCVLLQYSCPSQSATVLQRPAEPIKARRKRSHAPKPFAGLTHKPSCPLCKQEATQPKPLPPTRPEPMPPTHRCPRAIDTSRHFCPYTTCAYRGWLGLGNLRANGHPNGGPWRQFHCTACEGYFLETHGTIFHGKRVPVALLVHVLACLAEGLGIRATARVFEVAPNTVLGWLVEATRLNLSSKMSFALSWESPDRGDPQWRTSTHGLVPMPSFGTARRARCRRWKK